MSKFNVGDRVRYVDGRGALSGQERLIVKWDKSFPQPRDGHQFHNGGWDQEYNLELVESAPQSPADYLNQAAEELADRASAYDNPEGERSMGATVDAFNAITGHNITEEQGWVFMAVLKAVRSQQGNFKADSYIDGAAYFALAAETACKARG